MEIFVEALKKKFSDNVKVELNDDTVDTELKTIKD